MPPEESGPPRIGLLFVEYHDDLRRFLTPYVRNTTDIEDCIQQAFLNIWRQEERGTLGQDLRGYIFTSVLNAARNFFKRDKNRQKYVVPLSDETDADSSIDIEKVIFEREGLKLLEDELQKLKSSTRSVFLMYHVENKSFEEIAQRLGISTRTAEREMARALKHLRATLGPVFEDLGNEI